MANYDLYEIEELFNEETNVLNSKLNTKNTKRKWREIENFKEKQSKGVAAPHNKPPNYNHCSSNS